MIEMETNDDRISKMKSNLFKRAIYLKGLASCFVTFRIYTTSYAMIIDDGMSNLTSCLPLRFKPLVAHMYLPNPRHAVTSRMWPT